MRNALFTFVSLCSLMASAAHSAETSMRPGLWEITTTSDLLWLVPNIPPDQIQNFKDLAEQYGIEMPQVQMGEATSKACITQEMADQKNLPTFYQDQLGCVTKNATHIENKYKLDFNCSSPLLKGNGTAEGIFTNPERFSGQTKFDGVANGNPVNEHADISGRWISSSCGTVKPL